MFPLFDKNQMTKANFTNFEKEFIAELVLKYSAILENRRNDAAMCREKNATWEVLAEEFNNFDPKITKRTAKQLKKCWENLKTRAKKASLGLKQNEPYNMDDSSCETIVCTQPQVADLIAMQLKPICDVIKPLDEDDDNEDQSALSNESVTMEPDSCHSVQLDSSHNAESQTLVTIPKNKKQILISILPKPLITEATTSPPTPTVTTPTVTIPTIKLPTVTNGIKSNILRQTLASNIQDKNLHDMEQRLRVQLLKRKLEMAEEEHRETMKLLQSKRQYIEYKIHLLKGDNSNSIKLGKLEDSDKEL